MVEVFKTNVTSNHRARILVEVIQDRFEGCKVNFDLDDCDNILRIESAQPVDIDLVTEYLKCMGVKAEALTDDVELVADLFSGVQR